MLGRDVPRERPGRVQEARGQAAARRPDAPRRPPARWPTTPTPGVRRELILAFRNLPTDKVGEALKTLAAAWDGQDRWYLEALGLALEDREARLPGRAVRRHALRRPRPRRAPARTSQVAAAAVLPGRPQRGVHRRPATPDLPASPLSKTLGLAWRLHRPEVAAAARAGPARRSTRPELQQAADDVLDADQRPRGRRSSLAELVDAGRRPGRASGSCWPRSAASSTATGAAPGPAPQVDQVDRGGARTTPRLRLQGIALAAATGDGRYARDPRWASPSDAKAPDGGPGRRRRGARPAQAAAGQPVPRRPDRRRPRASRARTRSPRPPCGPLPQRLRRPRPAGRR